MTHFRPKKVALFPEIDRAKIFYHSPARIIECVSEYTFLISKNNKQTNKNNNNNNKNKKKQKKLKKKRDYLRKIDWKNKFAVARVKFFLVTRIRISGNKSIIFFGLNISR